MISNERHACSFRRHSINSSKTFNKNRKNIEIPFRTILGYKTRPDFFLCKYFWETIKDGDVIAFKYAITCECLIMKLYSIG